MSFKLDSPTEQNSVNHNKTLIQGLSKHAGGGGVI